MVNSLVVRQNDLAVIAQTDPTTAWLYAGGNRISIDNERRDGFVVKGSDEKLTEIRAIITTATQLYSHRQPDEKRDAPRHADAVEWCESRDNKRTNSQGKPCGDCAAFAECKWKIELSLLIADREGEYLMTIPTASSMRFKAAVADLAKQHKRHFSQVVWRMWVTVEKSGGNVFPVVNFKPLDPENGEPFGNGGTLDELRNIRNALKTAGAKLRTIKADEVATAEGLAKVIAEHKAILGKMEAM